MIIKKIFKTIYKQDAESGILSVGRAHWEAWAQPAGLHVFLPPRCWSPKCPPPRWAFSGGLGEQTLLFLLAQQPGTIVSALVFNLFIETI